GGKFRHQPVVPRPLHDYHWRPWNCARLVPRRRFSRSTSAFPQRRPCGLARHFPSRRKACRDAYHGDLDRLLSHRRAAWVREDLANHTREAAAMAISVLKKEDCMAFTKRLIAGALLCSLAAAPAVQAAELIVPALEYRTGAYAPNGVPFWNGFSDYLTLLNERDGGIGGGKIKIAPCEKSYHNKIGVEFSEKTQQRAAVFKPVSTGITYALIPKAPADKIPLLSSAYGRTSVANGKIFPWVFNFTVNYWSAASVIVKYIGEKEGGMDK